MPPRLPRSRRSLPFTDQRPRGLFIDRWGTLFEMPERGYVRSPSEVRLVPGAADSLFRACQAGWKIYLLGNEDAVARGKVSDEVWEQIQRAMYAALRAQGVELTRDYSCPDHPEGKGRRQRESVYRLPNTGAFHHAAQFDGLALEHSWVIGDSTVELAAGWRAGCRIAGVQTGLGLSDKTFAVDPPYVATDLPHALDRLLEASTSLRW